MGFDALIERGFVEVVNNMGTIIYERKHMTYTEVLSFHAYAKYYQYYGKRNGRKSVLSIGDEFHKIIDDIIRKELYWK